MPISNWAELELRLREVLPGNGCGAQVSYQVDMNMTACTSVVTIDETFRILLMFRLLDRTRENIAVVSFFVDDS